MKQLITICQYEGLESSSVLPLAAGILISMAKEDPLLHSAYEFEIEVERLSIDESIQVIQSSNIVGFSLYPWNVEYSLRIIHRLHIDF